MSTTHVLILAAGKGTRMKSARPKVLHQVAGAPMIDYVLDTAAALGAATRTVVVGHEAAQVQAALAAHADLRFVLQEPQLGTAHAVQQAAPLFAGVAGTLVLLSGDVPLLSVDTLRALLARHEETGAAVTRPHRHRRRTPSATAASSATATPSRASSSSATPRRPSGRSAKSTPASTRSTSSRCSRRSREIASNNAQKEFYLTDLVAICRRAGRTVSALVVDREEEILGINSRAELAAMSQRVWQARRAALMASGVTLEDPATVYVDRGVTVGPDSVIRPGVSLLGKTTIGARAVIHAGVRIVDSRLADDVTVLDHCLVVGSRIGDGVSVGPFAHIRPDSELCAGSRIGNFVEVKKTTLGRGSKASHLAYLGDATIGEKVNIGAGTITCNYDGVRKNPTVIEDGVFIGSDSQLDRAGDHRGGGVRGGRIVDHRGRSRPARSASPGASR